MIIVLIRNERVMQGRETQCKRYEIAWPVRNQTYTLPLYTQARGVICGNLADAAGTDAIATGRCGPTGRRYFDRTNEPKSK